MNEEKKQNPEELLKKIKELESQLATRTAGSLRFKVSEKGGVSVYGLSARFPVTLYADQWKRLLDLKDEILKFIDDNKDKLSFKNK